MPESPDRKLPLNVKTLGPRFLSYVLGIEEDEAVRLMDNGDLTSARQEAVVRELDLLLMEANQQRAYRSSMPRLEARYLADCRSSDGRLIAPAFREYVTQVPIEIPEAHDPVLSVVAQMCAQA